MLTEDRTRINREFTFFKSSRRKFPREQGGGFSSLKFIANSRHGHDQHRSLWRLLQLLAQTGNVHIDGARKGANLIAPHLAQNLITRQSDSFVLNEITQELKFPSRKIYRFAFAHNLSAADIRANRAKLVKALARSYGAAPRYRLPPAHAFHLFKQYPILHSLSPLHTHYIFL